MTAAKFSQNRLEQRGLKVSSLGFGSAPIGNLYGEISEAVALETVQTALNSGIGFFDTAPTYGAGLSEARLGKALVGVPRNRYVLQSKVGRIITQQGLQYDFSLDGLRRCLDSSLKRLGVSALDTVLLHDPDEHELEAITTALPELLRWREQGMVKAVGVGMNQWKMPLRFIQDFDLDVMMLAGRYTLLEQGGLPLLEECQRRGVAVLAAGVFNSGILATGSSQNAKYNYTHPSDEILERVQQLERIAAQYDAPLSAVAVQFVLAHPAVAVAVLGAARPQEISANLGAARFPIPPQFWLELQQQNLIALQCPIPQVAP